MILVLHILHNKATGQESPKGWYVFFDEIQYLKDWETNKLKSALVTTIDKSGSREMEKMKLHFLPSSLYAYTVGKNTILQKQQRQ